MEARSLSVERRKPPMPPPPQSGFGSSGEVMLWILQTVWNLIFVDLLESTRLRRNGKELIAGGTNGMFFSRIEDKANVASCSSGSVLRSFNATARLS
jgi:hypothetical protein